GPARMGLIVVRNLTGRAGGTAVPVSSVKEVDAKLMCSVHDRVSVFRRGQWPEVHRAQTQAADPEAGTAEVDVVHGPNLSYARDQHAGLAVRASLLSLHRSAVAAAPGATTRDGCQGYGYSAAGPAAAAVWLLPARRSQRPRPGGATTWSSSSTMS